MKTFFVSLVILVCVLFSGVLDNDLRTALIVSFAITWSIGLILPVLIRFAFARKPLSKWASAGFAVLFFFVNLLLVSAIKVSQGIEGPAGSMVVYFLSIASYEILRMRKKDAANIPVPVQPAKVVVSSEPKHSAYAKDEGGSFIKEKAPVMNDDAFYDEVAKELETNKLISGVWTRAFAEADGDENRAKAIYIKLRVAQMAGNTSYQKTPIQEKRKERGLGNWALAVVVLALISVVAYWVVTSWDDSSCSKAVLTTKAMPSGGDVKIVSREVVNERWMRNTYANGDATMSDKDTGLMWLYNANPCGKKNWSDAVDYCNNLTYAGYSDWRLPDKDTLEEHVAQKGKFSAVQDGFYWSGTSYASYAIYAWAVNMGCPMVDGYFKAYGCYVWPVRGGQ